MTHYKHPLFSEWSRLCQECIDVQRKEGYSDRYNEIRLKMVEIAKTILADEKILE